MSGEKWKEPLAQTLIPKRFEKHPPQFSPLASLHNSLISSHPSLHTHPPFRQEPTLSTTPSVIFKESGCRRHANEGGGGGILTTAVQRLDLGNHRNSVSGESKNTVFLPPTLFSRSNPAQPRRVRTQGRASAAPHSVPPDVRRVMCVTDVRLRRAQKPL